MMTTFAQVAHEAWVEAKKLEGYVFGADVDELRKTHPWMRPWTELQNWMQEEFADGLAAQVGEPAEQLLAEEPSLPVEDLLPTNPVETKEYSDGTTVTGTPPFPELSPAQQDAAQPDPAQ